LPAMTAPNQICALDVNPDSDPKGRPIDADPQDMSALTIADTDGDGRPEIIAALGEDVFALSYRLDPTREGGCALSLEKLIEDCPVRDQSVLVGDVDGVGGEDVVVICEGRVGGMAVPLEVRVAAAGRVSIAPDPMLPRRTGTPALGDGDGDGRDELLVLSTTQSNELFLRIFDLNVDPIAHRPVPMQGVTLNDAFPPFAPVVVPGTGVDTVHVAGYPMKWFELTGGVPPTVRNVRLVTATGMASGKLADGSPAIALSVGMGLMRPAGLRVARAGDPAAHAEFNLNPTSRLTARHDVHLAIGDIDGDGADDVVAATGQAIYSVPFGVAAAPVNVRAIGGSDIEIKSTRLVDIDGNPGAEIISYFVNSNEITIHNAAGEAMAGWPQTVDSDGDLRVVVTDLDGDTSAEIVVVAFPKVYVYSLGGGSYGAAPWPYPAGDRRGTGTHR